MQRDHYEVKVCSRKIHQYFAPQAEIDPLQDRKKIFPFPPLIPPQGYTEIKLVLLSIMLKIFSKPS